MGGRLDLRPNFFDASVRPDQEGHSAGSDVRNAHKSLWSPDAVGLDDFLFRIGYQCEGELILFHEVIVLLRGIGAHGPLIVLLQARYGEM